MKLHTTATASNSVKPTSTSDVPSTQDSGLSTGAIIGITIGCIVVCLLLILITAGIITFGILYKNNPRFYESIAARSPETPQRDYDDLYQ